jgi:ankyrin repeat protein
MLAFHNNKFPLEIISDIIQFGIKINEKDFNGNTILHIAAIKGHIDIIKYMIEEGGESENMSKMISKSNKQGKTPEAVAKENNYNKISSYL